MFRVVFKNLKSKYFATYYCTRPAACRSINNLLRYTVYVELFCDTVVMYSTLPSINFITCGVIDTSPVLYNLIKHRLS